MAITSDEESASVLFVGSGRGQTAASSTSPAAPAGSDALALVESSNALSASTSDLELRLLEGFVEYAGQQLLGLYLGVKSASRVTQFLGNTTEKVLSATGVAALVRFLFAQYRRLGGPLVGYVDDAMGKRIVEVAVAVLLLAGERAQGDGEPALEEGGEVKLTREERLQALLRGEVPRMKALLDESYRRGHESAAVSAPPPVVMELKDFVPIDEMDQVKEANRKEVRELHQEMAALRSAMSELNKEKQRLEQRLIDVHNYRESERGQRFQEMEEELARTKLEANQKAHDLRRLELVVEALRKKRKGKSRSAISNASDDRSVPIA